MNYMPRRCWINQPSTLQPLHKYHGQNVLAVPYTDDSQAVYFLSGGVISMVVPSLALSEDWTTPDPDEGLEIQRTLVVSTAHLPKPYFDWLQWQKRWNPSFHDVPLPTEIDPAARSNQYLIIDSIGDDYGWRICLAPGSTNLFITNHELDDPLAMLIRFAEAHDCDWLGIDRDGPIIPDLPTFEE